MRQSLAIPFAAATLFIGIQLIHGLMNGLSALRPRPSRLAEGDEASSAGVSISQSLPQSRIENLGGRHIFIYAFARLVGCATLLALSLTSLGARNKFETASSLSQLLIECPELFATVTFVSNTFLYFAASEWPVPFRHIPLFWRLLP
jgi:hypothetical protein